MAQRRKSSRGDGRQPLCLHNPAGIIIGVDADDRPVAALKTVAEVIDVVKLLIAVLAERGGDLLPVDVEGVVQVVQEPGDGVGGDAPPVLRQEFGDRAGRPAGPTEP